MQTKQRKYAIALSALALLTHAAIAEQVDNPDYLAWAACKPGATATLQVTSGNFTSINVAADGKANEVPTIMIRTERLVETLPDMAIISVSTSLGNGKPTKTVATVFAKIDKDLLVFSPQSPHPSLTAAKLSDAKEIKETLEVQGKPIETTKRSVKLSVTIRAKTVNTVFESWKSADVPGGLVKMILTEEGKMSIVAEGQKAIPRTDMLINYSKPEVATPRAPEELDDRTPQGLMRMLDRGYLLNGDVKKSLSVLHAETPEGKRLAEASAISNLSITLLEQAARDKFGAATMLPEEIDHAIGLNGCSRREIETATVEIDGDKAIVTYGMNQQGPMVRVAGRWRIDLDANAQEMDAATLKVLVGALNQGAVLADRLTKELKDGKYKTEEEFRSVMVSEMDKITPPQFKADAGK